MSMSLEDKVEADLKEKSDNWFNFNAEAIANVQAVKVGVLEASEDVEAKAAIDVCENSVKMSQDEEFVRIVVDPSVSFIALVYMQASLLDSE